MRRGFNNPTKLPSLGTKKMSPVEAMAHHDALPRRLRDLENYAPRPLFLRGPAPLVEPMFWQALARDLPEWEPLPHDEFERGLKR
jgi:hypothetical protein